MSPTHIRALTIMKKIILLLIVIITSSISFAQSIKDREKELNKANKEFMKQLEKKYDLKAIYVRVEEDGYWYFYVYRKGYISGILNQQGDIIVPIKYGRIEYKKPLDEGVNVSEEGDTVWHRANVACFHAETFFKKNEPQKYGIYRLDGTAMVDYLEANFCFDRIEGYTEYIKGDINSTNDVHALYTRDGECLIPMGYSFCKMKNKSCEIMQRFGDVFSHGSFMHGAIMLDGSLPPVPCQYSAVSYDKKNNQWMVTNPTTYEISVYDPNRSLTSEMKDKGVELFWSGKYDDVIDYYSKEGIAKPWAKYYTGASLLEKASWMDLDINSFIRISKEGKMDITVPNTDVTWRQCFSGKKYDLDLLKELYSTGYKMMDAYLHEDSTFAKEVKRYTLVDLDYKLNSLDEKKADFNLLWEKFIKENEAIVARQQAERERVAQRNQMLAQMLGIFVQSLAQSLNGSSNRGASYSGGSSRNVGSFSSVSSSSRSSSSSSSSSQAAPTQYRQCNKCRGTGDIFTTSTVGTYGNDKKVRCNVCGEEHWASTVHHHKRCNNCNGTGKVAK